MENTKGSISGIRPCGQSNSLIISSGIAALDELLGGGIPVGSIVLLEEDEYGSYAKVLLKYFLAEGVVSHHSTLIASQELNTETIIKELPAMIFSDPDPFVANTFNNDKMKIAFRYQNLPSAEKRTQYFGHYFDLSKIMPEKDMENSQIFHWNSTKDLEESTAFTNPAYHQLLQFIQSKLKDLKLSMDEKESKKTLLRIGLHCLGSPLWLNPSSFSSKPNRDLSTFIYCLKSLIQSAFAVVFIVLPSIFLDKNCLDRCIHSSDIAIKLESFAGTELEKTPVLSDYHGYFHLNKMAARNSLASKHPGAIEYVFKLKRKKLCIEKLHLPPDLDDVDKKPQMNCASGLDF